MSKQHGSHIKNLLMKQGLFFEFRMKQIIESITEPPHDIDDELRILKTQTILRLWERHSQH